jgi:hypothetical protein
MSYDRFKNSSWEVRDIGTNGKSSVSPADAALCVLMDIRGELKKLNAVFACPNFQELPGVLRTIRANTSGNKAHTLTIKTEQPKRTRTKR